MGVKLKMGSVSAVGADTAGGPRECTGTDDAATDAATEVEATDSASSRTSPSSQGSAIGG